MSGDSLRKIADDIYPESGQFIDYESATWRARKGWANRLRSIAGPKDSVVRNCAGRLLELVRGSQYGLQFASGALKEGRRFTDGELAVTIMALNEFSQSAPACGDDLLPRFRQACRSLIGIREKKTVYAEDVETMVDVIRVLERLAAADNAVTSDG